MRRASADFLLIFGKHEVISENLLRDTRHTVAEAWNLMDMQCWNVLNVP